MKSISLVLPFATNTEKTKEKAKENSPNSVTRKSLHSPIRKQIEFRIASIDQLIPADHRVRDVWDYVCDMDFSEFLKDVKVHEGTGGPRTKDPRIMMALWLFATLEGIASARHIDRLCKEHHAYIWLCGGVPMNYHSISDFRTSGSDKFYSILYESIALIWKTGLWEPNTVAQDGTRVKANAGKGLFKRSETLEEYLKKANEYVAMLEKELKENPGALNAREKAAKQRAVKERKERIEKAKAEREKYLKQRTESSKANHVPFTEEDKEKLKASITDPESRKMKMGDGGYRAAYNVQFATTTDKKVIVGVDVVNTLDPGTLAPMMQQVASLFEKIGCKLPVNWLCDSAYANKSDTGIAEKKFPQITLYSPPVANSHYDAFTPRKTDTDAMRNLRKRMATEEAQVKYKERTYTAEFANARTKNLGMTEFLVRGLTKVKQAALLYAITHNMIVFFGIN